MIDTLIKALPCTLCVAAAVFLAALGRDSWGWFLFAAVILAGAI